MVRGRFVVAAWSAILFGIFAGQAQAEQLIISYDQKTPARQIRAQVAQAGSGRLVATLGSGSAAVVRVPDSLAAGAIAQLRSQDGVKAVEKDSIVKTFSNTPDDPGWGQLWGMTNIGLPDAWYQSNGSDGTGITVAVTDTGVALSHPDLANQLWDNPGETPGNGVDDDGNGIVDDIHGADFCAGTGTPEDGAFHGTHVAGIIAAERGNGQGVAGVAPGAKIMGVRFIGNGCSTMSMAVNSIDYARVMGAKVINASWGGSTPSTALKDAIGRAKAAGILFLAAAGNDGKNIDQNPTYPASYSKDQDNMITVDAIDSSNNLASFSNYGSKSTNIGAPGVGILSTVPTDQYGSLSGTSMATPYVAGAVAAMWGKEPAATYLDIKNALYAGATTTPSLAGKSTTGKRLNLAAAFDQLDLLMNGPKSVQTPVLQWVKGKLSCSSGTWSPAGPKNLVYSWTQDGRTVVGANKNNLTPTANDLSSAFICQVAASNDKAKLRARTASSNSVTPNNPPPLPGNIRITGFNGMDGLLTCDKGTWQYGSIDYAYVWKRDGQAIDGATSATYTITAEDRNHSLTCTVTGTNAADSTAVTSQALAVKWADDLVAPAAAQVGAIPAVTNKIGFNLALKGERDTRFYCSLDDARYVLCTSPLKLASLSEGSHSLAVKQQDRAGNYSDPTSQNWTVDVTAPDAPTVGYNFDTSASDPVDVALPATSTSTTVAFFLSGENGSTFKCSLNNNRLDTCTAKRLFSGLKVGTQTFRYQQTDAAGNTSPVTTLTWTVTR